MSKAKRKRPIDAYCTAYAAAWRRYAKRNLMRPNGEDAIEVEARCAFRSGWFQAIEWHRH